MNSNDSKKIGLLISGTKGRQGGFQPIVIYGIIPFDYKTLDNSTLVGGNPVYKIEHRQDYILYQFIDRQVKSYNIDTLGVLNIAMVLPKEVQLTDGKSPYALLKDVYEMFRENNMKPNADGTYSFLDKEAEQEKLAAIVEGYKLELRTTEYVPMNAASDALSGMLYVEQEKEIEDLFRDSQYPEFKDYKSIEIGRGDRSKSSNYYADLSGIQIPRPIIYTVYVNGQNTNVKMSQSNDCFAASNVLRDTEDVRYDKFSFCLSDLDNENNTYPVEDGAKSYAKIDRLGRRIDCKVHKERITYTLTRTLTYEPGIYDSEKKEIENQCKTGNVVFFGGEARIEWNQTEIPASSVNRGVRISPSSLYLSSKKQVGLVAEDPEIDRENRSIKVTITVKKKVSISSETKTPTPSAYPIYTGGGHNNNGEHTYGDSSGDVNSSDIEKKKTRKLNVYQIMLVLLAFVVGVAVGLGTGYYIWNSNAEKEFIDEDDGDLESVDNAYQYSSEVNSTVSTYETSDDDSIAKAREDSINKAKGDSIAEAEAAKAVERQRQEKLKQAKQYILNLVNTDNKNLNNEGKLKACRAYWDLNKGLLTDEDKNAVEAILDIKKYTVGQRKKINDFLKDKYPFKDWDELLATKNFIIKIISEK